MRHIEFQVYHLLVQERKRAYKAILETEVESKRPMLPQVRLGWWVGSRREKLKVA